MTRRALIVCPGRGSYGRDTLGWLLRRSDDARAIVARCDAWRTAADRPTVSELDQAPAFSASRHAAGEHASLLTFACGMVDLAELEPDLQVVGVTGNSMGWYTALGAAGALPLDGAIRLVETMGAYQADHVIGGQVIWPLTDDARAIDRQRIALVDAILAEAQQAGHGAWWSIRLGTHAVLGADEAGVRFLLERLPKDTRGSRVYPMRLPLHSAFHTPLLADTSARARRELADLPFQAPTVPLFDGRGAVWRPRWADPEALAAYTLGHQVVAPYDLGAAVHSALSHVAPDVVVVLGPGSGLVGTVEAIARHHGFKDVEVRGVARAEAR